MSRRLLAALFLGTTTIGGTSTGSAAMEFPTGSTGSTQFGVPTEIWVGQPSPDADWLTDFEIADDGAHLVTGSLGLRSSARIDTGWTVMEPEFRLSLDQDFETGAPPSELGRWNIYVEERDVTEFDLDNAISLRMKGIVPGWFHYETRIRVRTTGLRSVTGRIRFKW